MNFQLAAASLVNSELTWNDANCLSFCCFWASSPIETNVSVTMMLASLHAFFGSCEVSSVAPVSSETSLAASKMVGFMVIPSGLAIDTLIPLFRAAMARSLITLLASPTHASFRPLVSPKVSLIVRISQMACNGW
ncbi:hypothetical protein OGAPHI_001482 [Ogataea philodendri]|uniref:Uncharacterized protein n=1 Tax=Ogataea philodendri TaxID=1378263 RepID=A0A9P8T7Z8_9ASCO|nr:uncharacterized protein OGAPHI_001482 [Ogataea philodendri]KAH3669361.1 hypothetical protein OGAPHI_001482 [Ogataea philodendri]